MKTPGRAGPCILIASDNAADAAMVKALLGDAFDKVHTSTDPDTVVADYEDRQPQVLVLAFDTLAKAQRCCLSLYRLSRTIHLRAHRTVILCGKDEVHQVAALCMKRSFDDYVLFWPMNHDAPRLRMAVYHALRDLLAIEDAGPSAAEFAAQARRLSELEGLLERQMASGGRQVDAAQRVMNQAEQDLGTALDGLAWPLRDPAGREVADRQGLHRELDRFKREEVRHRFATVQQSLQPIRDAAAQARDACAPYIESVRALSAMADRVRPTVMVVDDDELQRKMVARMLEPEPYRLVFAASGAEALNLMGRGLPDLVLMDVQMPGMDGIEATRRLKAVPSFANVTVIMVTGKSEGSVVAASLSAGAADFVVKPVDRLKLLAKVARWSRSQAGLSAK